MGNRGRIGKKCLYLEPDFKLEMTRLTAFCAKQLDL